MCIFPWIGSEIDWVSISIAMVCSGSVLAMNFFILLKDAGKKDLLPLVLGLVIGLHVSLTIVLKFYFFHYTAPKIVGTTTSLPLTPTNTSS